MYKNNSTFHSKSFHLYKQILVGLSFSISTRYLTCYQVKSFICLVFSFYVCGCVCVPRACVCVCLCTQVALFIPGSTCVFVISTTFLDKVLPLKSRVD